jgi:hypothetical protein
VSPESVGDPSSVEEEFPEPPPLLRVPFELDGPSVGTGSLPVDVGSPMGGVSGSSVGVGCTGSLSVAVGSPMGGVSGSSVGVGCTGSLSVDVGSPTGGVSGSSVGVAGSPSVGCTGSLSVDVGSSADTVRDELAPDCAAELWRDTEGAEWIAVREAETLDDGEACRLD